MRSVFPFARRLVARYSKQAAVLAIVGGSTASFGYAYKYNGKLENPIKKITQSFTIMAQCAAKFFPQPSVINGTKEHALYLTIHLRPNASINDCLKTIGDISKHVDSISPPDLRDETDEIWCGVGFGEKLMTQLKPEQKPANITPFGYRARSGPLGDMPDTGGDIFIHAKCDQRGKLFELCQAMVRSFPLGSISSFEDVYGWVYRNGRDLTGFIDGTENPADEADRVAVAIDPKTGGSFVITQKWVHKHDVIHSTKDDVKAQWVGREISDSTELRKKTPSAHVSRMVGSAELDAPAKYQIVRHSQPYGTVSGDSGLFFIGYSATPVALDWMLDRMTGLGDDKKADDIMRMTQCMTGTYWYFPSQPELNKMVASARSSGGFWR